MRYPDDFINKIICGDCVEAIYNIPKNSISLVLLDPPFDKWDFFSAVDYPASKTTVAFTNYKHKAFIEEYYGIATQEIIWHFPDGRWVSNNLPQQNHENILIYGERYDCYVGETNKDLTPIKKGKGCIGSDKNLGERVYQPREKKMLSSVITIPRNMSNPMGAWGKPLALIKQLIMWLTKPDDIVLDPFLGSGTTAVACKQLGRRYIGIEINPDYCKIAEDRLRQEELF